MDEVDEIDENHMESNDAFAAYVTWIDMNIININNQWNDYAACFLFWFFWYIVFLWRLKVAEGGHEGRDRPPVYCPELGLAIEQLKDGYTLDSLWQILPPETSKKNLE